MEGTYETAKGFTMTREEMEKIARMCEPVRCQECGTVDHIYRMMMDGQGTGVCAKCHNESVNGTSLKPFEPPTLHEYLLQKERTKQVMDADAKAHAEYIRNIGR